MVRAVRYLAMSLVLTGIVACKSEPNFNNFVEVELTEDPIEREALRYADVADVPVVYPTFETQPVSSLEDAADDPAIWVHPEDANKSLILGTDKRSGIAVYSLDGTQQQFLPLGLPNNIDLRQGVAVGSWSGDLAVASNRDGDVVSLLSVSDQGVKLLAEFSSAVVEPYGICMGLIANEVVVFVTYKDGQTVAHHLTSLADGSVEAPIVGSLKFSTQLEGCVVNDDKSRIYIGEEEKGLWLADIDWQGDQLRFSRPKLIDHIVSRTGITADVEGVSRYHNDEVDYLVISSQGNDSYSVYRTGSGEYLGRFRVAGRNGVDGAQETDGLDVNAANLGDNFPKGILVVQDGFNAPSGTPQNFKVVDWREVERALGIGS